MASRIAIRFGPVAVLFLLGACTPERDASSSSPSTAEEVAALLLDESVPGAERHDLARRHVDLAPAVVRELTADLEPGTDEEYRRIPFIWRAAVTAGQGGNGKQIVELMEIALPDEGEPLHDWQAVVLGGGIVDGIADGNDRPLARTHQLLADRPRLRARWDRAVGQASAMADDETVPNPTRYDALIFLGMGSWASRHEQLLSYLGSDIDDELRRGAIGGLSAMDDSEASEILLSRYHTFTGRSRAAALDALLVTPLRISLLLDAVESGRIMAGDLGDDRIQELTSHPDTALRERAQALLAA